MDKTVNLKNHKFWDDLCGSDRAKTFGITEE